MPVTSKSRKMVKPCEPRELTSGHRMAVYEPVHVYFISVTPR